MKTPQQIVDAWNEKYPVGTRVRYREMFACPDEVIETETIAPAEVLCGDDAVVRLKWFSIPGTRSSGLCDLSRCEPITEEVQS